MLMSSSIKYACSIKHFQCIYCVKFVFLVSTAMHLLLFLLYSTVPNELQYLVLADTSYTTLILAITGQMWSKSIVPRYLFILNAFLLLFCTMLLCNWTLKKTEDAICKTWGRYSYFLMQALPVSCIIELKWHTNSNSALSILFWIW